MTDNSATDLQKLADKCAALPPGEVANVRELGGLLANAWDDLEGGDMGGMKDSKLIDRMENVRWDSPILRFEIERHGARKFGSTRAELQFWEVNVVQKSAACVRTSHRELEQREPNYPMPQTVSEVLAAIHDTKEDERLKWDGPNALRILTGVIFPKDSAVKRTLEDRRKRFRLTMESKLCEDGWESLGRNKFRRS